MGAEAPSPASLAPTLLLGIQRRFCTSYTKHPEPGSSFAILFFLQDPLFQEAFQDWPREWLPASSSCMYSQCHPSWVPFKVFVGAS